MGKENGARGICNGVPLQINHDPHKPREEHHYHDYYPDLDEDAALPVTFSSEQDAPLKPQPRVHGLNAPLFKQIPKEVLPRDNSRIHKSLARLGYRLNTMTTVTSAYIRENSQFADIEHNNDFFRDISPNQMNFKVAYDMDEQDDYYLAYLNDTRTKKISRELLECAMTVLENEWYHLERKIPPKIRTSYANSDEMSLKASAARAFTELYGSDDGIGVSVHDEQACAVCDGTECDNTNAIVFCDGCDIAVHQDCYGVIFIPEGQWLCRRCMVSKKRKIRCQFCPSTTGAFKQTENGLWSHVLCGLWIPELYFASAGHMEPVEGIETIPKGRWKLQCYLCKQKMGAPIQCANRNCFLAFHATCAKRAGLEMTMKNGVQGAVLDKGTMTSWCHKHTSKEYLQDNDVLSRINKTMLYFATVGSSHYQKSTTFQVEKKSTNKRWKTSCGTPLPPNYFITVLERFFSKLKVHDSDDLALKFTKYWSMKRETKRGAPLVRRTDATAYSGGNPDDIPEKLSFAKKLLGDIAKLEEISSLLIKRADLELQAQQQECNLVQSVYFPYSVVLSDVMDKILKIDSSRFLVDVQTECLNLGQMRDKVYSNVYRSINDFISDLEAFLVAIERMNQPVLLKAMRRITKEVLGDIQAIKDSNLDGALAGCEVDGLTIRSTLEYNGFDVMLDVGLSDIE